MCFTDPFYDLFMFWMDQHHKIEGIWFTMAYLANLPSHMTYLYPLLQFPWKDPTLTRTAVVAMVLDTLSKTKHLKIGLPKRKLIFQPQWFRCYVIVSGRVWIFWGNFFPWNIAPRMAQRKEIAMGQVWAPKNHRFWDSKYGCWTKNRVVNPPNHEFV